jgi:diguanylate cyclase (GGDEF)-like protein
MLFAGQGKRHPRLSLVPAAQTASAECLHRLDERDAGVDLARENAALRAMLAKMQDELTDAHKREKRSRYLAFHDDLTALPNRRFFLERLGRALMSQGSSPPDLAVIYLDLDGFKVLNDAHGHATGDRLLNLIASRLAHALRAQDVVSRLGGDEFACLVIGASRPRLRYIAMTLFEAVAAPFKIGLLTLSVRPSIGVAMCPSDGTTVDTLVHAADAAMYRAKRNRSSFAFADGCRNY